MLLFFFCRLDTAILMFAVLIMFYYYNPYDAYYPRTFLKDSLKNWLRSLRTDSPPTYESHSFDLEKASFSSSLSLQKKV